MYNSNRNSNTNHFFSSAQLSSEKNANQHNSSELPYPALPYSGPG